jgi:hypothetical protein
MKRLLSLSVLLVALLIVPASAQAKGGLATKLATKACAQEKKEIGSRAFLKRYGRKSMPTCVKKARTEARRAVQTATAECQAEVDDFGIDEFLEDWDSFEQCVADLAESEMGSDDESDDDLEDDEEV